MSENLSGVGGGGGALPPNPYAATQGTAFGLGICQDKPLALSKNSPTPDRVGVCLEDALQGVARGFLKFIQIWHKTFQLISKFQ